MKKLISLLLIIGFLAGGVFTSYAGQPSQYVFNAGDARWSTKLNAGLDALWGNITDFSTLITNWVGTDSYVVLIPATPTYSNGTTFTVPGDYTSRLTAGKVVQVRLAATTVETTVVSSTYASPNTTVVLTGSVLTNPITRVYVVATRDGLWPNGPGYVVAADYGTDQAALVAADGLAAAAGKQLVIGRTYSITSTPVSPLTSNLKVMPGGTISIANGVTLTINGPLNAGLDQIFSCTGTGKVVFAKGSIDKIYPEWWGTNASPGTADMFSALTAALVAGKDIAPVCLSNVYGYSANLHNYGTEIYSTYGAKLIPSAAVTVGMTLHIPTQYPASAYSFRCRLQFDMDGSNTTSATGLLMGSTGTFSTDKALNYDIDANIYEFAGTGAYGVWVANAQTCRLRGDLHGNQVNLKILAGKNSLPTTIDISLQSRQAVDEGIIINTGININLNDMIYESNGKEGLKVLTSLPLVSGQQIVLNFTGYHHFENNWLGDAGKANKFSCVFDATGITGTTICHNIDKMSFDTSAILPKAIQWKGLIVNSYVRNLQLATSVAGCLEINGTTSQIKFDGMPNYNWASILSNVGESILVQGENLPWLDWTPTVTCDGGGSMDTLTFTNAKYKVNGRTISYVVEFNGTLTGAATTTLTLSYPHPGGVVGINVVNAANVKGSCTILDNNVRKAGAFSTSSYNLVFKPMPVANFTAGAGVGASVMFTGYSNY